VSELESAIADAGALLVRAQKYRRGAGPEGRALGREALALGDAARRLHRHGALDDAAARALLGDARALAGRLRGLVAEIRSGPDYRAAKTAHAAGDRAALTRLLPAIFAGLEPAGAPSDLFAPVAWLRRGRLRSSTDVVADVLAARAEGLVAEGDDLSAGADGDLPAVTLLAEPPPGEPIILRVPPGALALHVHRLVDTGELLVHAPRVVVPGALVRLARALELDEELRVAIAPREWERFRDDVTAGLRGAAVPIETV